MEWYERWFDTEFYHLLYKNRDDDEAHDFLERLTDFLNITPGSKIIDIACGRGRHSIYLNKLGHDVTGIDLSKNSIDFARQYESSHLKFFCFDKRKTWKEGYYDYAFNLFTSFGYVRSRSELSNALRHMAANLRKGGIFVLDHMNEHLVRQTLPYDEHIERPPYTFAIRKEVSDNKVVKTIDVMYNGKKETFHEEVHLISLVAFEQLFKESGLKILHTFGDYQLGAYNPQTSDRLILIGQKD